MQPAGSPKFGYHSLGRNRLCLGHVSIITHWRHSILRRLNLLYSSLQRCHEVVTCKDSPKNWPDSSLNLDEDRLNGCIRAWMQALQQQDTSTNWSVCSVCQLMRELAFPVFRIRLPKALASY